MVQALLTLQNFEMQCCDETRLSENEITIFGERLTMMEMVKLIIMNFCALYIMIDKMYGGMEI